MKPVDEEVGSKNLKRKEKRGSFEGAIRVPLRALLFLFNNLVFLCIPRTRFQNLVLSLPPGFSQVFILKIVKVLCFDTLVQVFILKVLSWPLGFMRWLVGHMRLAPTSHDNHPVMYQTDLPPTTGRMDSFGEGGLW